MYAKHFVCLDDDIKVHGIGVKWQIRLDWGIGLLGLSLFVLCFPPIIITIFFIKSSFPF